MIRRRRRGMFRAVTIASMIGAAAFAGCQSKEKEAPETSQSKDVPEKTSLDALPDTSTTPPVPLDGSEWRLVKFQSMDDAVGTVRPLDPTQYTLGLGADSALTMQVHCNRVFGVWSAEPAGENSGGIRLEPRRGSATQCPTPDMSRYLVLHLEHIRSYSQKNGRLYLSLMADGGIFEWEPIDGDDGKGNSSTMSVYDATPDARIEAAVLDATPTYTPESIGDNAAVAHYVYGRVDLNGDGREEVFVLLMSQLFCRSGGCEVLLFTDPGDGYSLVNRFPLTHSPLIVSPGRTGGWNDLVRLEMGGSRPAGYFSYTFDGEKYVEKASAPLDRAPEGFRCMAGQPDYGTGTPLEPRG